MRKGSNRLFAFPFIGASYHLSFKRQMYFWGGKGRVQGDFTSFTLGAGTLDAFGLTPAANTVVTIATSGLGTVVPGAMAIVATQTSTPAAARRFAEIHDGTTNERVTFNQTTANQFNFAVVDGGVTQSSASQSIVSNRRVAIIGSFDANAFKLAVDGVAGTQDTSGTLPTVTTLQIGHGVSANTNFAGFIEDVIGFNRTLTQSELNELSAFLRAF